MTIDTLIVVDPANPVEVQTWLNNHQEITTFKMYLQGNIFYLIY